MEVLEHILQKVISHRAGSRIQNSDKYVIRPYVKLYFKEYVLELPSFLIKLSTIYLILWPTNLTPGVFRLDQVLSK